MKVQNTYFLKAFHEERDQTRETKFLHLTYKLLFFKNQLSKNYKHLKQQELFLLFFNFFS